MTQQMKKQFPWKCARCGATNLEKICSQCGVKCTSIPNPIQGFYHKDKKLKDRPPRHAGSRSKVRDMNKPVEERMTEPQFVSEVVFQRKVYYQGGGSMNKLENLGEKWSKHAQYDQCQIMINEYGEPTEIRKWNRDFDPTNRKNPKYWFWRIKIVGDLAISPEGIKEIAEAIRTHESLKQENEKLRIALKTKRTQIKNEEAKVQKLLENLQSLETPKPKPKKKRFCLFKKSE